MRVSDIRLFENTAGGGFTASVTVIESFDVETANEAAEELAPILASLESDAPNTQIAPEPEPEKPTRRRRGKNEEKPTRRRRGKKTEPSGPTKEDVALAASKAAEELGTKLAAEIIGDYSDTGKIDDIPEDKREEFIKEVELELSDSSGD